MKDAQTKSRKEEFALDMAHHGQRSIAAMRGVTAGQLGMEGVKQIMGAIIFAVKKGVPISEYREEFALSTGQ